MLVREMLFLSSDVCSNYVLSVLSASPPNNLVVSFLTGIQYILTSALISRCRDSYLYDCQFFIFWKLVTYMVTMQPCNLVQLIPRISVFLQQWLGSKRPRKVRMGIVFEISADFRNSMMFYLGHFYYYFYSPPIQVDPAQKFRESCAFS